MVYNIFMNDKKDGLSLYEESLMEEWLAIVGMRVFAEHYFEFKQGNATLPKFSKASAKNRMIAASSLFKKGYHLAALKRIARSSGVSHKIASLADAIYLLETR